MGYLLSLSALKGTPSSAALHQLPRSLPWKLYRAKTVDVLLLDVFNVKRGGEHPFSSIPAIQDLSLQFEEPLTGLNELYESLRKKNRENGFKRAFVNLNLIVSRLAAVETLSFVSDDEGVDLACISGHGALHKLRFRAGSVEVNWTPGEGTSELKRGASQLHRIAEEECASFLGQRLPIFGFDGDVARLDLERIDMSPPLPPPQPKPPRGGWAAHERRQRELARAQKKWWQFWK
jgi:hypothetical protein